MGVDVAVTVAELDVHTATDLGVRLDDLADALGQLGSGLGHVLAPNHRWFKRLEVDVDPRGVRQLLPKRPLELGAGPCRGREADVAIQLCVHAQVQRAVVLPLHRHVVEVANAAVTGGRGVDALDKVA